MVKTSRGKCPNAESTSGCFCTGACKRTVEEQRQYEVDWILAQASGGESGGSMFARYEGGDNVYTQR